MDILPKIQKDSSEMEAETRLFTWPFQDHHATMTQIIKEPRGLDGVTDYHGEPGL